MRNIISGITVIALVSSSAVAMAAVMGGQDRAVREIEAAPATTLQVLNSGQDRNVGSYLVRVITGQALASSGQDRNVNAPGAAMSRAVCAN